MYNRRFQQMCGHCLVEPVAYTPVSGSLVYAISFDGPLLSFGAAMVNLAHSASFHSTEKIAPSKPGIKHL